jgi:hypothetical protein
MLENRLWGKFHTSQISRLYLTRGIVPDALKVMETSFGTFSVTLDSGDIAVNTATNLNNLLDMV